jgi:predicted nucleic acid-binding protein
MRLYLDACAIIYAIESALSFGDDARLRIAQAESSPAGALITSRLFRMECRVKPLRDGRADLLAEYDEFFDRTSVVLTEISAAIVERATALRALHGFKTADSLHLATAIEQRADVFLTGDVGLARCPGLIVEVLK